MAGFLYRLEIGIPSSILEESPGFLLTVHCTKEFAATLLLLKGSYNTGGTMPGRFSFLSVEELLVPNTHD